VNEGKKIAVKQHGKKNCLTVSTQSTQSEFFCKHIIT